MIVGEGILTWDGAERRSDRYGTVQLIVPGADPAATAAGLANDFAWAPLVAFGAGQHGALTADVLDTRTSAHIGDLFRRIFPSTPEVGEVLLLGRGRLFTEEHDGGTRVGLRPDPMRKADWLDPHVLYRLHSQTVRLTFTPEPGP